MEIKVGEYVRTKTGNITKVYKVKDTVVWTDEFLDPFGKYHEGIVEETDIAKHSKNIIDLIQKGDYVNGRKVSKVNLDRTVNKEKCILCADVDYDCLETIYSNKDIKSILTKEQFKSMEYILEEE